jgi:DNA-binding response OmpR family regulator
MKILLIEDDTHIIAFLKRGLLEDGHHVEISQDGEEGEYLASINSYDLIILDWMLPSKSGIEILESLRKKHILIPILMLTAKGEIEDKVRGLNSGADDYLPKPFSYVELLARIEALYRRSLSNGKNEFIIDDLNIDMIKKIVTKNDSEITLSAKEYELLFFLIKNKNTMVSTSMIEEHLWNCEEFINSNVIQVTIYNLRKKIGKNLIKSFRGLGYKIEI